MNEDEIKKLLNEIIKTKKTKEKKCIMCGKITSNIYDKKTTCKCCISGLRKSAKYHKDNPKSPIGGV